MEEKVRVEAAYERRWQKYLLALTVNVGASVVGSVIFAYL